MHSFFENHLIIYSRLARTPEQVIGANFSRATFVSPPSFILYNPTPPFLAHDQVLRMPRKRKEHGSIKGHYPDEIWGLKKGFVPK